jgi:2-amino-4-hydroxy-6-hydroxymethyldihydropteridine diphosphokinase
MATEAVRVFLGLGSNIGNREENLRCAYTRICGTKGIQALQLSRFYDTMPVGGPPQPMFLNAALAVRTILPPHQLLEQLQRIETEMGRVRTVRWGPRTIDIDILLYGDVIITDSQLTIPHPLMHERLFVLQPLAEIAPDAVHPIYKKTVSQLKSETIRGKL